MRHKNIFVKTLTIHIDDLGLVVASFVSNSNLLAYWEITTLTNATTDNRLLEATVAGRLKPANRHETHVETSLAKRKNANTGTRNFRFYKNYGNERRCLVDEITNGID